MVGSGHLPLKLLASIDCARTAAVCHVTIAANDDRSSTLMSLIHSAKPVGLGERFSEVMVGDL